MSRRTPLQELRALDRSIVRDLRRRAEVYSSLTSAELSIGIVRLGWLDVQEAFEEADRSISDERDGS